MQPARALAFDFNGTLSHDEPVLFAIYSSPLTPSHPPMIASSVLPASLPK